MSRDVVKVSTLNMQDTFTGVMRLSGWRLLEAKSAKVDSASVKCLRQIQA
jgi:hypothetical protein